MKKDSNKAKKLRKKFWNEVIGYFSDNKQYAINELTPSQTRIILSNGERIDFYPSGQRICWIDRGGKWDDVEDIEKFINELGIEEFDRPACIDEPIFSPLPPKLTIHSLMPIGKFKGQIIKDLPKWYLKYIYENRYTSDEIMELLHKNKHLLL